MMYRGCVLIAICMFLLMLSCDSVNSDSSDDFSIEFSLRDSSHTALGGYQVSIIQKDRYHSSGMTDAKPSTNFHCMLDQSYRVEINITDYFHRNVRKLVESNLAPGAHIFHWNGLDDEEVLVRDGIYRIKAQYYTPSDSLAFSDYCLAYKLGEFDAELSPYVTDSSGRFRTTDIIPFPVLYCQELVDCTDEHGNMIKVLDFSALSDTMEVIVTSPEGVSRSHYFRIRQGKNVVDLNWDTLEDSSRSNHLLQTGENRLLECTIKAGTQRVTELSHFQAVDTGNASVQIVWVTEDEFHLQGFVLYRNDEPDLSAATQISQLIPATNGSGQQLYEFEDVEVEVDHVYYYWLMAICQDENYYYGPVSVYVSPLPPVIPTLNLLSQNYPNPFN